jgi:hypothetical protein
VKSSTLPVALSTVRSSVDVVHHDELVVLCFANVDLHRVDQRARTAKSTAANEFSAAFELHTPRWPWMIGSVSG